MSLCRFFVLIGVLTAGCGQSPSRDEALAAFHAAEPGVDSGAAMVRVWSDGPPWFSCAEVIAKLKSTSDHAVVRDQVGRWRQLVMSDWLTLHDTSAGAVVEPGWCTATLRDSTKRLASGW